jgi:hypothetical protein
VPIAEPATVVTDLLLATVALVLGARLERGGRRDASPGRRLWGASFGAAALAAAAGALRHGWGPRLPVGIEQALWFTTALAIAAAGGLLLAGAAFASCRGGMRRGLLLIAALRVAGLAAWTATHREYLALGIDAALGTALVLVLLVRAARQGRFAGLGPLAAGFGVGLGGALLRQLGVAPHPDFNENDLYHLVQIASLWLLYRAGRELRSEGVVASPP